MMRWQGAQERPIVASKPPRGDQRLGIVWTGTTGQPFCARLGAKLTLFLGQPGVSLWGGKKNVGRGHDGVPCKHLKTFD